MSGISSKAESTLINKYKYNDKGHLVEKKTRYFHSNSLITVTYTYNDTGKLIKLDEKSDNGVTSSTTYQYNDKGLLESDTWKGSLSKTAQRTSYKVGL